MSMSNSRIIWAIILIAIGAIAIAVKADFLDWPFTFVFRNLFPIGLIALGIYLIVRQANKNKPRPDWIDEATGTDNTTNYGAFNNMDKVFGDLHFKASGFDLNGMNFSTTFGDMNINLEDGKLSPGNNRLSASAIFGDVTITVPKGMAVFATGSDTFGDLFILGKIASGISNHMIEKTEGFDAASEKLYINAKTVFGDVRVYQT